MHVVDLIEKNDETTKMYDKTGNEYSFGAAMATGIQYSDPNNFTSNSEYVVGARILLVFDMPKQENPRNLSVVYLFKETWEASEQISRVNIVF